MSDFRRILLGHSGEPPKGDHDWQAHGFDKRGRVVLGCWRCRAFLRGLSPPVPADPPHPVGK